MTITKNVWKAAALLLILCLVSAVMISGTYAKYTDTYAGEDTAMVAKWEIDSTGSIFNKPGIGKDLDLFSHAYDEHMTPQDGSGNYIIAPGVTGDFIISFDNNSDVDADINFQIATTGTAVGVVPVVYSFTSPASLSRTYTVDELEDALNSTYGAIAADPSGTVPPITRTVYWSWPFDLDATHDTTDTTFGTASAAGGGRTSYGLIITASAVQVMPQ